jgi:hypothetical protein
MATVHLLLIFVQAVIILDQRPVEKCTMHVKRSLLILKATEIIIGLWPQVLEQLIKLPARPRKSRSVPMTAAESRMASGSCRKVPRNGRFLTSVKRVWRHTFAENWRISYEN